MVERFTEFGSTIQEFREFKAVGVEVGDDGRTAVAYGIDSHGVITTLRQEGTIGELPRVKGIARKIAQSVEATFIPPGKKPSGTV